MVSTPIAGGWRSPARGPVARETLRDHHKAVAKKLYVATLNPALAPADALERVFRLHFGRSRTPTERLIFLHYASPIVRTMALDLAHLRGPIEQSSASILREQLSILRVVDPEALRMIDMHYFGGCTVQEIAGLFASATGNSFVQATVTLPIDANAATVDESRHARAVARTLRFWSGLYRQCQRIMRGKTCAHEARRRQ